ncbi:hypothetical protein PS9374_05063 [Planomonospora sphaerica]|uniref:Uncharacterized protein n=1 Tax=Planomonospora sphaerica TaxID=161355 RepID=A0A171DKN2_9ACTN|nr:hypothetical protein PS9374_05063 [Planomonospora sphaerica]
MRRTSMSIRNIPTLCAKDMTFGHLIDRIDLGEGLR